MLILYFILFIVLFSSSDTLHKILIIELLWINFIYIILLFLMLNILLVDTCEHFDDKIIPSLGICSKNCCPDYWNNKMIDNRIKPGDIGQKYITSDMACSDGVRDIGCVCLKNTKQYNPKNYNPYDSRKIVQEDDDQEKDFLNTDTVKMIQF